MAEELRNLLQDYHSKGSKGQPAIEDGTKMIIYGTKICPFVLRVLLTLDVKNVDYKFIGIDLMEKPEWYLEMYPAGKVPYMVHGDKTLPESLILVNYLEDAYPSPALHPSDPYQKAKGSLMVDEAFPLLLAPIKCLKDSSLSSDQIIKNINDGLAGLDSFFGRSKDQYLQGNKAHYSDYMIWPFLNMLVPICRFFKHPELNSIPSIAQRYPALGKHLQVMEQNANVKKVFPSADLLQAYYEKYYST